MPPIPRFARSLAQVLQLPERRDEDAAHFRSPDDFK
jgi:hypothetical protein